MVLKFASLWRFMSIPVWLPYQYHFLPYHDSPTNWRVFVNGERARTVNSAANKIPGLYASVTNVRNSCRLCFVCRGGVSTTGVPPVRCVAPLLNLGCVLLLLERTILCRLAASWVGHPLRCVIDCLLWRIAEVFDGPLLDCWLLRRVQGSTSGPPYGPPYGYLSAAGIPSIAFEEIDDVTVVTAYGSYPIFLVANDTTTRGVGLAWILNMLQAPRGQGTAL